MSSAFSPNNSGAFFRQCTHEAPFFCGFPASLLPDTGYTRKVLVAVKLCGLLPPYSLFQVKDLLPHVPNSQKRWSCPCVLQGFLQILSHHTLNSPGAWCGKENTWHRHIPERHSAEFEDKPLWGRVAPSRLSPPQTVPPTKDLWVTPWSHNILISSLCFCHIFATDKKCAKKLKTI